ncbi:protein of unknown function (plasmid) [Shinella sp. WSC3-e]|nr:protein of unknown function [Shinella sp. WSC3-e]
MNYVASVSTKSSGYFTIAATLIFWPNGHEMRKGTLSV